MPEAVGPLLGARALAPAAFDELALGDVRPHGWLLDQLRLQAAGLTGHLDQLWPDVGANSAWLGGTGEAWERGPYYLDGLLPLAHLLDDAALLEKAGRWVEAILASQRPDGFFGPPANDDWWPRMVALKALTQHADATGDPRVVPFVQRYFRHQLQALPDRPLSSWGQVRGADNVLSVYWLHARTGEAWLLDLAALLLRQTADWGTVLTEQLRDGPATHFSHLTHGPNVAMGLKTPALRGQLAHDPDQLVVTDAALEALDRHHGLVHGVFSGDEWLGGRDPQHGVETCLVVELMFSLAQLTRIFGQGRFADRLELVAFNALPASCTADMTAHQYHQQPNQVLVNVATRDWSFSGDDANVFGLEPHFGCCTANLHQGWPKLLRSMWMRTPAGLAATVYGPNRLSTAVSGAQVDIVSDTEYPFGEQIRLRLNPSTPVSFRLSLRVPAWCEAPRLSVNDQPWPVSVDDAGFTHVERTWDADDEVTLDLPMRLRTVQRDRGALGLRLGPLVLAVEVQESWRQIEGSAHPTLPRFADWEVQPRKSWNFGLLLDPQRPEATCRVERRAPGPQPFEAASAPVWVWAKGARLKQWGLTLNSADLPPVSPVASALPMDGVRLIPYGCARLRIAEFPRVDPTGVVEGH